MTTYRSPVGQKCERDVVDPSYLLAIYIENTRWCLLISSLPGKALRTLVDLARLAERFNMRSQS